MKRKGWLACGLTAPKSILATFIDIYLVLISYHLERKNPFRLKEKMYKMGLSSSLISWGRFGFQGCNDREFSLYLWLLVPVHHTHVHNLSCPNTVFFQDCIINSSHWSDPLPNEAGVSTSQQAGENWHQLRCCSQCIVAPSGSVSRPLT